MTECALMTKTIKTVPGTRVLCPENCRYRNKLAPFCGYCIPEVMKKLGKREGDEHGNRKEERDRET